MLLTTIWKSSMQSICLCFQDDRMKLDVKTKECIYIGSLKDELGYKL